MKKIGILAALLCGALICLTSCQKEETWSNQLGDKILGPWISEYDAHGTLRLGLDEYVEYTHVVQYAEFKSDCTGIWCAVFFGNNMTIPVWMFGGQEDLDAQFRYNAKADGTITVQRNLEVMGLPDSWTVFYENGQIAFTDGGISIRHMDPATPEQKQQIIEWEQSDYGNDMGMIVSPPGDYY